MIQIRRFDPPGDGKEGGTRFRPGAVVCHRRYGYRGVVVGSDDTCRADETWYQSNQSQPERAQPWYHVLVDRALHTTYVAESNLRPDPSGEPVAHPLLAAYFEGFEAGYYVRNDRPWEG
jgi:heat shock protein HspQ